MESIKSTYIPQRFLSDIEAAKWLGMSKGGLENYWVNVKKEIKAHKTPQGYNAYLYKELIELAENHYLRNLPDESKREMINYGVVPKSRKAISVKEKEYNEAFKEVVHNTADAIAEEGCTDNKSAYKPIRDIHYQNAYIDLLDIGKCAIPAKSRHVVNKGKKDGAIAAMLRAVADYIEASENE